MTRDERSTPLTYVKFQTEKQRLDNLAFASFPEDYLPYTSSYHRKAPYLVWDDDAQSHRKCKRKKSRLCSSLRNRCRCCSTAALVTTIVLIVTGILAVVAVSIYLGVLTSLFISPVFTLRGRLRVTEGDNFTSSLLDVTSPDFKTKANSYEVMLQRVYDSSTLQQALEGVKVFAFREGSLSVFFRLNLDRRKVIPANPNLEQLARNILLQAALVDHSEQFSGLKIDSESLDLREGVDDSHWLLLNLSNNPQTSTEDISNQSTIQTSTISNSSDSSTDDFQFTDHSDVLNFTSPSDAPPNSTVQVTTDLTTITFSDDSEVVRNNSKTHHSSGDHIKFSYGPWTPYLSTRHSVQEHRNIPSSSQSAYPHQPPLLLVHPSPLVPTPPVADIPVSASQDSAESFNRDPVTTPNILQYSPPGGSSVRLRFYDAITLSQDADTSTQRTFFNGHSGGLTTSNLNSHSTEDPLSISSTTEVTEDDRQLKESEFIRTNDSSKIRTEHDARSHKDFSSSNELHRNTAREGTNIPELLEEHLGNFTSPSSVSVNVSATTDKESRTTSFVVSESSQDDSNKTKLAPDSITSEHPKNDLGFSSPEKIASTSGYTEESSTTFLHSEHHTPPVTFTSALYKTKMDDSNETFSSQDTTATSRFTTIKNSSGPDKITSVIPLISTEQPSSQSPSSLVNEVSTTLNSNNQTTKYFVSSPVPPLPKVVQSFSPNSKPYPNSIKTSQDVQDESSNGDLNPLIVYKLTSPPQRDWIDKELSNSSATVTPAGKVSSTWPNSYVENSVSEDPIYWDVHKDQQPVACSGFTCTNGQCVSKSARCNRKLECWDNSDEENCSCANYLWAFSQPQKICDGVLDCKDYSDENRCGWCSPDLVHCFGERRCIEPSQMCDGIYDCTYGTDERYCVRLADDSETANHHNHQETGYLMIQRDGIWGKLCLENLENLADSNELPLKMEELGKAVCSALSYQEMKSIERVVDDSNRQKETSYFEISSAESSEERSIAMFQLSDCPSKDVVRVACKSLECGMRPMSFGARRRIVGGRSALFGSWPWQAALYKEGDFQCGAVLINDQWLLSAGHCFYVAKSAHWTARLGMLRRGLELPSPFELVVKIRNIVIHPDYVDKGFINDIALLKLDQKVPFSDFLRPACLPEPEEDGKQWAGQLCSVVGWGKLFEQGHTFPDTLQEVRLPVIPTQECRKKTVFLPIYKITENMFCAGYDRGGRDACLGDSGGPLMCQRSNGRWVVIGITSNGDGCGRPSRPGVYTKIANYLSWIDNVVKEDLPGPPIGTTCAGHRCHLGRCLPLNKVCDNTMDCADGSDEANCPKVSNTHR